MEAVPIKITMLTGPAGVGKDTFARELIEGQRYTAAIAFADYLKYVASLVGWNGLKDKRGRTFLQHLGDVVREYDNDFWAKYVVYQISENPLIEHWVITDLRYDSEYLYIRDNITQAEIEVVKLVRDFVSPLSDEQKQHPTELGISENYITSTVDLTEG
jgi:hypothetical protein